MAKQTHSIEFALTFDYGQRALVRELSQARKIAEYFRIPHRVISLPWFKEFSTSALLSHKPLPAPSTGDLNQLAYSRKTAQAVWVPNRNGVFIEVAASFADECRVADIVVGFNREEATTFPDNSSEYLTAVTRALSFSTANCVRVVSPTAELNKTEIVKHAKRAQFPFELLWSCYESLDQMCGECESCMRLKRALHANEVPYGQMFKNPSLH